MHLSRTTHRLRSCRRSPPGRVSAEAARTSGPRLPDFVPGVSRIHPANALRRVAAGCGWLRLSARVSERIRRIPGTWRARGQTSRRPTPASAITSAGASRCRTTSSRSGPMTRPARRRASTATRPTTAPRAAARSISFTDAAPRASPGWRCAADGSAGRACGPMGRYAHPRTFVRRERMQHVVPTRSRGLQAKPSPCTRGGVP
jgi:hypothetical protein